MRTEYSGLKYSTEAHGEAANMQRTKEGLQSEKKRFSPSHLLHVASHPIPLTLLSFNVLLTKKIQIIYVRAHK